MSEFRAFSFNSFLYGKSDKLFPEIKEFGLFLDDKIITTYGVYEKYEDDLYNLFFGNKRNLLKLKSLLGILEFINNIMEQMILAIKIMHDNGLVHGDIKFENFLFKKKEVNGKIVFDVVLCDFGFTHNYGKEVYSLQ